MRRRKLLAIAGGIGFGSNVVGSTNAVKPVKEGIDKFEQFTFKLGRRHGNVVDVRRAVRNMDGEVQSRNDGAELDTSPLYDGDMKFASVEVLEFEDGETLEQEILCDGSNRIFVDVGHKRFKLKLENVNQVLEERLHKARRSARSRRGPPENSSQSGTSHGLKRESSTSRVSANGSSSLSSSRGQVTALFRRLKSAV